MMDIVRNDVPDDCPTDDSGIRPFIESEHTKLLLENAELKRRLTIAEAMLERHFLREAC